MFEFPSHFHFILGKPFRHEEGHGDILVDILYHVFTHGAQGIFLIAREVYSDKDKIGDNIYRNE